MHGNELAVVFFVAIACAATQDIAVDGWALTLLSEHNITYASTCQSIGVHLGYSLSYTAFLPLNSPEFWFVAIIIVIIIIIVVMGLEYLSK